MQQKLRYLWVYSAADEWTVNWHDKLIARRRERGFDVEGFCNTPIELERKWLPFYELDKRWQERDPVLLKMYADLAEKLVDKDVLILYNGANIHPEFIKQFNILKVYTAGDDPESTEILTKPVAPAFDIHLVNNIACLDMYRSWGLDNVHFWPLGSLNTVDDVADITEELIRSDNKNIPIVFLGGYQSHRQERFDKLVANFSEAYFAGSGWPRGFITYDEYWQIYRRAAMGWNFHNSIGPINFRTYELPAFGIMQLCDNKSNLGKIYELNKEVVGFDDVDEAIELTKYYLAHPQERKDIAVAGWQRWKREYHPDAVWQKLVDIVEANWPKYQARVTDNVAEAKAYIEKYSPSPTDLAGKAHWDTVYGSYDPSAIATSWQPESYTVQCLERMLINAINVYKPKTVMEIGAGNSKWLPYLAKKTGVKVFGLDYSEAGCEMARQRLQQEGVEGEIFCADLFAATPAEIGQFDLVFSLGVVEHFDDLENATANILKFVAPGGQLLTEVPNLKSVHGLLSWLYQPKQLAKHQVLTKSKLLKTYRALGLENIEAKHLGLMSFDIVAWGYNQRFPRLDKIVIPVVRCINSITEHLLQKINKYRGFAPIAPFLYAIGTKSK